MTTTVMATTLPLPESFTPDTCLIQSMSGVPLARAKVETTGARITLRQVWPSGPLAAAFFGHGQRHFQLAFPDGRILPMYLRQTRWDGDERRCDILLLPLEQAA
jgi:hypothetical protein